MVARVSTVTFQGIGVLDVDVQAQMTSGFVSFNIVGLPDQVVTQSRERVRGALEAIGLSLPPKRITINLAPADRLKEGSHFDLPIALALLVMMDILPAQEISEYIALGELALDGQITSVGGVLGSAVHASSKSMGLICPSECGSEAAWAGPDLKILAPDHLLSLINHFKGTQILSRPEARVSLKSTHKVDMSDIKGQEAAKKALEVAAAGGHNILFSGPPGVGKSMLASRLTTILPPLTPAEALETSMIHSMSGLLKDGHILYERPYRAPHHTASTPSLVGGGQRALPGEISLSHHGVLFLDELPEFSKQSLEALRQPLEARVVTIARANHHVTYPANIQLVAAMNPCRCGHLGSPELCCNRAPKCAIDYQNKISGPIYDRIDCHVAVDAVHPTELSKLSAGESSLQIRDRVIKARDIQRQRYLDFHKQRQIHVDENEALLCLNAHAEGPYLEAITQLDQIAQSLLTDSVEKLKLSARGYHRILKLARTLADLDGVEHIHKVHIAQALFYRKQNVRKQAAA